MLRIIADSTCDISKEDARKMGIQIVPKIGRAHV